MSGVHASSGICGRNRPENSSASGELLTYKGHDKRGVSIISKGDIIQVPASVTSRHIYSIKATFETTLARFLVPCPTFTQIHLEQSN